MRPLAQVAAWLLIVAAALLVASGCGEDDAKVEPKQSGPVTETFEISIADGVVEGGPKQHKVKPGTKVVVEILSDQADDVHLHGIDISTKVGLHEPGRLEFTAKDQGSYDMEAHTSGVVLGTIVVS